MIILDQLPSIHKWAAQQLQCNFVGPIYTIAKYGPDGISCVVVFHNQRVSGCEVSIVSRHGLSKDYIKHIFGYAFECCKLSRLTALVEVENPESIKLVERLGFVREGTLRKAADNGNDLHIYGMLKEDCRWVRNQAVAAVDKCHPPQSTSL